jgi:CubicO group peptidase (beta-lactamase class C family)
MNGGGFSRIRLDRMSSVLGGYVERGEIPGIVTLVSRRGETHVHAIGKMALNAEAPIRRDALFRIASMTKPITAVAAMILVEESKLRLDDPVDDLLPELANRQVLKHPDSPLDHTVPADRAITLRDLLTFRMGLGLVMAPPGQYPIQQAMTDSGLSAGPNPPAHAPDKWMQLLGELPLIHQPGEAWMYHTPSDVLGVLIARASGQPFETFLRERIFQPLGMMDTGFSVPKEKLSSLPTSYETGSDGAKLKVHDEPANSRWSQPPAFPSGGGGLVSTIDNYLAFYRMILAQGRYTRGRILSRPSIELMLTNHLTPEQQASAGFFLGPFVGWGFGLSIQTMRGDLSSIGRFGWDGGLGTSAYADPREEVVGILMTQRLLDAPEPSRVFIDFWTSLYQAIDD